MCTRNLNRLIGTAVIDGEFRAQLLADPTSAVQGFGLSAKEHYLIVNTQASDLAEFAQKVEAAWTMEIVPVGGPPLVEQSQSPVVRSRPLSPYSGPPIALHLN